MAVFDKAEFYRAVNFSVGHRGHPVKAVVVHVMEGPGEGTVKNWLNQSGVSWHFSVTEAGKIYQHVDTVNSAWANGIWWDTNIGFWRTAYPQNKDLRPYASKLWKGLITSGLAGNRNPNFYTISIENGGYTGRAVPQAQFVSNIDVIEWVARSEGWTKMVVGENLIGHRDIDPVNRAFCPGTGYDLQALADAVNARLNPEPIMVTDATVKGWYVVKLPLSNVRSKPSLDVPLYAATPTLPFLAPVYVDFGTGDFLHRWEGGFIHKDNLTLVRQGER